MAGGRAGRCNSKSWNTEVYNLSITGIVSEAFGLEDGRVPVYGLYSTRREQQ